MSLQPLFPLEKQFQGKSGRNLTGGYLMVFLSGTDDPATTYSDYVGTLNPERSVLDDNGRAVVICDADLYYRLEVYDENGMLLWTEEPVACTGGGAAAAQVVTVESTDGSVDVTKTVVGSNTYFDLSTKVVMDEPLDWIKAGMSNIPEGTVVPSYDEGTMYTTVDGISVTSGRFYHTTTWLKVLPAGDGISYETLSVAMRLNGNTLWTRTFDIDNSLSDPVNLEVSYDLDCQEDGYVDFEVTGVSSFSSVDLSTQFHRIFNGYSSEYAKKTWVTNSFVNNAYLNIQGGTITGISGTPIGGISEATVSSIASSYAESAASSKLDTSAFTSYTASALTGIQQDTATISAYVSALESSKVDQSAFDACCSAVSAQVSSLISDVSSIQQDTGAISAAVSGLTGTYIQYADLESADGKITGISGTALWGGHEYTGIWPIVVDNTAEKISAANKTLAVDETMTGYASGDSAVIGVNTSTVLSGLTAYQPAGDYAYNSAVSAKLDASASSEFYSTSNPSGFITGVDLSDYATTGYVDSSVSGKLDTTAFNSADFYSTSNPSGFITGVDLTDYATTGYVDSAVSGKADSSALTAYQEITGMTAYQPAGDYYSATNPSGFITGVDLSNYATTGYVDSSVSGKLDASASGEFYLTSNPSGFITGVDLSNYATTGYVDSSVSGKQDISGMTAYQPVGTYIYESALGWAEV